MRASESESFYGKGMIGETVETMVAFNFQADSERRVLKIIGR